MNTSDTQNTDNTSRPFGYWLKAADRLMADEFATAFEAEHASRRDWRILNVIDGTVPASRPLAGHKLHRLVERGWVAQDGDGWTLTDEGRAAKERLGAIVDGIRSKVSDAVPDEEMATTLASLEKIARAFGWDEEAPLPRGRRHGFGGRGHGSGFPGGFGRRFGRGFGPGRGFDPESEHDHGFGHGFGPRPDFHDGDVRHGECGHGEGRHGQGRHGQGRHGHPGHDRRHGHDGSDHRGAEDNGHRGGDHRGHGPHRVARVAQHAYERGFDAGFSRGRDA
ncbi:MAG: hypothetical protein P0Y60_00310 [Candidatus Microbacterium colombiense]|nr:MAG: hypothetical protein P0Y60_00310 [Microbacterium sp.]